MEPVTARKILIITTGQPSLNPRMVKEADALTAAGHEVEVLYQYWNNWASEMDATLLKTKKWKATRIGGDPVTEKVSFHLTRIQHGFSRLFFRQMGIKTAATYAISRSSIPLLAKAKSIPADLYIGHNIGALGVAVIAAKHNKAVCGFDAEDFHRYETGLDDSDPDVRMKTMLEEKYFPSLDFLITSSPLITEAYKKLFPSLPVTTILNAFPDEPMITGKADEGTSPLKLFWFSQTIGKGRGLEDIIKAMGLRPELEIELHMLGQVSSDYKKELQALAKTSSVDKRHLVFHDPINPAQLIEFGSRFDIGLATETGIPYNREICLTNKIFSYIQSGLAVLASNTLAQQQLLGQYPTFGTIYQKGNIAQISSILKRYHSDRSLLVKHRQAALKLGRNELNWKNISKQLVSFIESHLR
jgi:glycosyltransferase involved in cell wall biosynthesis